MYVFLNTAYGTEKFDPRHEKIGMRPGVPRQDGDARGSSARARARVPRFRRALVISGRVV